MEMRRCQKGAQSLLLRRAQNSSTGDRGRWGGAGARLTGGGGGVGGKQANKKRRKARRWDMQVAEGFNIYPHGG